MNSDLRLRIILEKPPPGVDFGLQKGKGSNYDTIQKQRSSTKDLIFDFLIVIKPGKAKPDFAGPFVQGPSGARFVYIDIGTYAGQENTVWSRRLKIPLQDITWDTLNQLSDQPLGMLETHIKGTGKDGGPNCGTVKPFNGWKLAYADEN
jgi:Family of unknown function (DUF5990)